MPRSHACAISTSLVSRSVGRTCFGGDRPLTCPAISCFAFWPIGCRPIGWVTLMLKVSSCSIQPVLLKTPANARSRSNGRPRRYGRARCWLANGTAVYRGVAVVADGFAWNGKTYRSLSKVAQAITGTRWNGPKFFGLRDKPSEDPKAHE